jgi:hypothetical protein
MDNSWLENTLLLLGIPILFGIVIGLCWWLVYNIYMKKVTTDYAKHIFDIRKVRPDSSLKDKMLHIYFKRQQTYELSAYIILGIAMVLLIACILIFLFANSFIIQREKEQGFTENHIFISGLTIRGGIALIILFITRVLLKLYRYCLKIGSFNLARFDALLCQEDLTLPFKEAIEIFNINADVGEEPTTPTQEVVDILKQVNAIKK